jgi:hypothetical protein
VPLTKLSIHKQSFFKPGPSRYEICDQNRICGGYISVFNPLNSAPSSSKEQTKNEKTKTVMENNKLNFDNDSRIPISFNPMAFIMRPASIKFNTTDLAKQRKRKSKNRNVAFMCGTTRFENQPFQASLKMRPEIKTIALPMLVPSDKLAKKLPQPKVTNIPKPCVTARTRDKIGFTYAALPEPKLIKRNVKSGAADGCNKEFFQTVNAEIFYEGTSSPELIETGNLNVENGSENDNGVEKESQSLGSEA